MAWKSPQNNNLLEIFGFELAKMIAGIKLAGIKSQYSIVLSRSQEKDVEKKSSFAP